MIKPTTMSWADARRVAAALAEPLDVARVEFSDAIGSVLAERLYALTDLPAADTAAMDGWAICGPGPWTVVGEVTAGRVAPPLADGNAIRISTGAIVPANTSAVLRREHGLVDHLPSGDRLLVGDAGTSTPSSHPGYLDSGTDIRPTGEECVAGDSLLDPGRVVTPAVVGLAAAAGYDGLAVIRPPGITPLIVGDELLDHGLPTNGLIRDALGPLLPSWLRHLGGWPLEPQRVPDTIDDLRTAIKFAAGDVIITTGSTARGPRDHLHEALAELHAQLHVDGVAVRPGHPMVLATLPDGRHLVGLPGNPFAAVSALLTLVAPLISMLRGDESAFRVRHEAMLSTDVQGRRHETCLLPITREAGELVTRAVPVAYTGPAMLRGLAVADALAVIPPGGAMRGQSVELLLLPQ
jgi:molybdopterin molybdotransferase